jgi:hypothetical protein
VAHADSRHLADDRLIAVYVARREEREPRRRVVRATHHLSACNDCARRYDDLVTALDVARDEAVAEADQVFTAARLDEQRDRVLRDIAGDMHPAEVIPFPFSRRGSRATYAPLVIARRWVAAAAAAGLLLGLSAGQLINLRPNRASPAPQTVANLPHQSGSAIRPAVSRRDTRAWEEQFLSEVDEALYRPQAAELRALDALTPRVQEARNPLR